MLTQVHGSRVHGSRLKDDENLTNSKMSMNRPDERVLLFVDLSIISRHMKRSKQLTVNREP
jgi:hypothetical protein